MSQGNYTHLSHDERQDIWYFHIKHAYSIRETARRIERNPSTVSRELARNRNSQGIYGARSAHRLMKARQYRKKTGIQLKSDFIRSYVEEQLPQGWSPAQIAGRLPIDHPGNAISHESIYLYVHQQGRKGDNALWQCLPQKRKKRKTRHRTKRSTIYQQTTSIQQKTPLSARSVVVNNRLRPGDWELDTIIGSYHKSAIAVGVERVSRYVCISALVDRSAVSMRSAVVAMLIGLPPHLRQSITVDNGPENALHQSLSRMLDGIPIYFCEPYKSWQKGAVENMNGIIRRVFPKGTNFTSVDPRDLIHLQRCLNTRPRKCLGWRTPQEVFTELYGSEP